MEGLNYMDNIKIKIRPYNKSNKKDKIMAKIMEELANKEKDKFNGVIREINRIQFYLETLYGITIETGYWGSLLNEVIKLNLKNNIEKSLGQNTIISSKYMTLIDKINILNKRSKTNWDIRFHGKNNELVDINYPNSPVGPDYEDYMYLDEALDAVINDLNEEK